ncbi:MAG: hypothetical protein ACJ73N_04500 [Bryobacteraceae bacterium]
MDVKQYFRKMREIENGLTEPYQVVVSLETSDGGKAGMVCEVPRSVAAKMIIERRAALASIEEKELFFQQQEAAKKAAEKAELARRVQVAIITDSDLQTTAAKTVSKK